ncbi:hypothetical protein [Neptuniibacter halophilus]|uniref:hypothetical protein n=1 Tax=Neptuniibacter halophilus TaxID=651666 RepID=UPI0025722798|nr:hypothetical protein [Neptuniibacter halophilus]
MPVALLDKFEAFIRKQGVGDNDQVADSVRSYVGYLNAVSKHLAIDINPSTLNSEQHIERYRADLQGLVSEKTIGNYTSAMRQYVALVESGKSLEPKIPKAVDTNPAPTEQSLDLAKTKHFRHSSFREKMLEHLFISELLKRSWLEHHCDLEIAKPEVDSKGYDLIAENNGVVRHIQLKSTKHGGNASSQTIHTALASKPSGCVVWMEFNDETLELGPFLFFGGSAGKPLPCIDTFPLAKHTKGNAEGRKLERPQIRKASKNQFEKVGSMDELYDKLFSR